ncbi:MAG: 16S rRNA (cytosine(1402)-N(4))-methyltransferase, partial [Acidimicrobiales bacterium]
MSQAFEHRPVMLAEVVELFGPAPAGLVADATVGGGGHAAAILAAHPHLSVLGLDRDGEAVTAATARLGPWGERAAVVHA